MKLAFAFASVSLILAACGESPPKPAESPAAATSASAPEVAATPAPTTPASASASAPATAATEASPPPAPAGVEKTVEMKWEIVADKMCQAGEKHVRLRFAEAPTRYEDVCSKRFSEELGKKKPKTLKVTFLVYTTPNSTSLCDVDGFFKGVRLAKMGCNFPDGWDKGAGAAGLEGKDVPHPLFK